MKFNITYDSIKNNKVQLALTCIALENNKKDFYKFYKEILFMLK